MDATCLQRTWSTSPTTPHGPGDICGSACSTILHRPTPVEFRSRVEAAYAARMRARPPCLLLLLPSLPLPSLAAPPSRRLTRLPSHVGKGSMHGSSTVVRSRDCAHLVHEARRVEPCARAAEVGAVELSELRRVRVASTCAARRPNTPRRNVKVAQAGHKRKGLVGWRPRPRHRKEMLA